MKRKTLAHSLKTNSSCVNQYDETLRKKKKEIKPLRFILKPFIITVMIIEERIKFEEKRKEFTGFSERQEGVKGKEEKK